MKAREEWEPAFAAVYGVLPWHMRDLTAREVRALRDDLRAREEAADGGW